jgi:hypothetical protein
MAGKTSMSQASEGSVFLTCLYPNTQHRAILRAGCENMPRSLGDLLVPILDVGYKSPDYKCPGCGVGSGILSTVRA